MSVDHFPIERVAALRARARDARQLPGNQEQRWQKSPVDPMNLLRVFSPHVRLTSGWLLRAYRISGGLGGGGLVYAMQASASFPEPDACMTNVGDEKNPVNRPAPPGGVPVWESGFLDLLESDGSPWSYLCVSLLRRELCAFGEEWHAIVWGNRTIIGNDPADPAAAAALPQGVGFTIPVPPGGPPPVGTPAMAWFLSVNATWPTDWRPQVTVHEHGGAQMSWYLHSGHMMSRIWRETDTFAKGSLRFTTSETAIAGGPLGFVH